MTQRERDRLVALRKADKKLITQKQAAQQTGLSERHLRRLLAKLRSEGDQAVVHAARGRASNRKLSAKAEKQAVAILSQPVYAGFGPTLAAEYLEQRHGVQVGRETLRRWMAAAGLWKPRRRKSGRPHPWRPRRSCCGELVQWDTSEHDWLEGRGEKLYLIGMIDDASSELLARFVRHDSGEENRRLLKTYLEQNGRPVAFYTDRASLFVNTPKNSAGEDPKLLPPTQIGRALQELDIESITAYSPQAKGRVERSFGTAQDRLVKGLRVAGEEFGGEIWDCFTPHYTPKHGSWLNQAEIEIGLFSRQCLGKRRIPDLATLRREAAAWNRRVNRERVKIDWRFDRKTARRKFGYKRPTIKRSEN